MGIADYQKQKQIKVATERAAQAGQNTASLIEQLLVEQRKTNDLLTQLLAKA